MTKGKGRNPGASNLDKHIKRKEHKERSQPAARLRLGQLEKQKDHALRAKKRRAKVQRLNEIKRAAAQRNPDEFNIGMTKAVMDVASGRIKKRRERVRFEDRAEEMKKTLSENTRNIQYLEYKGRTDLQRACEVLNEEAPGAFASSAPVNKHYIFVDDDESFDKFNVLKYFDTTPEMLKQHPIVRGKISVLKNTVLPDEVLLTGPAIKSVSQRRKERRELQEKLRRTAQDDLEARATIVASHKAKKELKLHRFSNLDEDGEVPFHADDDGGKDHQDEAARMLSMSRKNEQLLALRAARRVKEVTQRVERSKSLLALAKTVRRQNSAITRQLMQKKESRFKPNATRRAR